MKKTASVTRHQQIFFKRRTISSERQQALSRKRKGSAKHALRFTKAHERVANVRNDLQA